MATVFGAHLDRIFQQVMKELLNSFDIRMPQVATKETCPKFTELLRDLLKS